VATKDVGIRIRVDRELRDAFQRACDAERQRASELLRDFMRAFANKHANGRQRSLFAAVASAPAAAPQEQLLEKDHHDA
jgi:hypothetical protein